MCSLPSLPPVPTQAWLCGGHWHARSFSSEQTLWVKLTSMLPSSLADVIRFVPFPGKSLEQQLVHLWKPLVPLVYCVWRLSVASLLTDAFPTWHWMQASGSLEIGTLFWPEQTLSAIRLCCPLLSILSHYRQELFRLTADLFFPDSEVGPGCGLHG